MADSATQRAQTLVPPQKQERHLMQQSIVQALRQTFWVCKQLLCIVFIFFLWKDLSDLQQSAIATAFVLAVMWAVLLFFDPVVDILLRVGIIALVVLVSLGYCRQPTLLSGVGACSMTAAKLTFYALSDVIHRLLGDSRPELIESYLLWIAANLNQPSPSSRS
jgi:hypothetical protein